MVSGSAHNTHRTRHMHIYALFVCSNIPNTDIPFRTCVCITQNLFMCNKVIIRLKSKGGWNNKWLECETWEDCVRLGEPERV